jgi:hypothetical protein
MPFRRDHRRRTRHSLHPNRADRVDRQGISSTIRRAAADHPPHHRQPAGVVALGDDDINIGLGYPTISDEKTNDRELRLQY